MAVLFEGILYKRNPKRFGQIRELATGFSSFYIGQNIIQDDIFAVIENYARTKGMPLEWLRFPIQDPELYACTFVRGGRIFVMLNAGIPISKQIFAAAHELYHIRSFLEDNDSELAKRGSLLEADTIETGTAEEAEVEANAFAGILLVPVDALEQQIRIFQINKELIETKDILTLMDIFAVPYKAMVLRLLEEKIISDARAKELIDISFREIKKSCKLQVKQKDGMWFRQDMGNLAAFWKILP